MINLLPIQAKELNEKSERYCALTVFCLTLSVAFVALAVFALPAYIASGGGSDYLPAGVSDFAHAQKLQSAVARAERANSDALLLDQHTAGCSVGTLLEGVLGARAQLQKRVLVTELHMLQGRVNLTGVAHARDDVSIFSQALSREPHFKNVRVPVNSFIPDRQIPINLNFNCS